jgi:hypothetical protein
MPMERVLKYVLMIKGLFTDTAYTNTWLYSEEFTGADVLGRIEIMLKKVLPVLTKEEAEFVKKESYYGT